MARFGRGRRRSGFPLTADAPLRCGELALCATTDRPPNQEWETTVEEIRPPARRTASQGFASSVAKSPFGSTGNESCKPGQILLPILKVASGSTVAAGMQVAPAPANVFLLAGGKLS
jgi:hypothetical protein